MRLFIGLINFILLLFVHVQTQAAVPPNMIVNPEKTELEQIQVLLGTPDSRVDFAKTKLTIDKIIDPTVDVEANLKLIDSMVADIEEMLEPDALELEKVLALRKYLYDSGAWNDEKPFSYDLADPLGQSKTSRLLHNYLRTRKGNCVSMPILHAILGRKLGLDMTLSTAPLHVFVIFTNEQGHSVNIEATSGGHPSRDIWYQQKIPMTKLAVSNGVYMKKLSDKEAVVVMAKDLASRYLADGRHKEAIELSNELIKGFPSYAPLYLVRGSSFYMLIEREFFDKYPEPDSLPAEFDKKYQYYMRQNNTSFRMAEILGWRDPNEMIAKQKKKEKKHMTAEEVEQFRLQIEAINRQNGAMMPFVHSSVPPRQGVSNPISSQPRFPTSPGLLPYPPNPNGKVQPFK